jgi:cytochrome c peroxidase
LFFKYLHIYSIIVISLIINNCCQLCTFEFTAIKQLETTSYQQSYTDSNQIELGKILFFDKSLSINNNKSCSDCHNPRLYFTDGYKKTLGALADILPRNTPSLINSVDLPSFNWASPTLTTFQQQMQRPLFASGHIEMGMDAKNENQAASILSNPIYAPFLQKNPSNWQTIIEALAAFQSTIVSRNSTWDAFLHSKDSSLLSNDQLAGAALFFSKKTNCSNCHGGKDLNTPIPSISRFVNTGIYSLSSNQKQDAGLFISTKNQKDIGKFRIPSLRNIAQTAPYYHDGSGASLGDVINNYATGGRFLPHGAFKGNGKLNKLKSPGIKGFHISATQKRQLLLFLETLTDTTILQAPFSQDPFTKQQ